MQLHDAASIGYPFYQFLARLKGPLTVLLNANQTGKGIAITQPNRVGASFYLGLAPVKQVK